MIDRKIRETRSKEEKKKTKIRAVITAICVLIVLHFDLKIMNSVGKALLVDGEPVIPGVGLIQLLVGIVFFGIGKHILQVETRKRLYCANYRTKIFKKTAAIGLFV